MATKNELLKQKMIDLTKELLRQYEEDITSGLKDGTYEEEENVETLQFIEEGKATIEAFEKMEDTAWIFVEGGIVQGISASKPLGVTVFDKDNFKGCDEDQEKDFLEMFGHPKTWDAKVKKAIKSKEMIAIL